MCLYVRMIENKKVYKMERKIAKHIQRKKRIEKKVTEIKKEWMIIRVFINLIK